MLFIKKTKNLLCISAIIFSAFVGATVFMGLHNTASANNLPNIGLIDLDFCNEGNTGNQLKLEMDMGTSTGVCMNIKNGSNQPVDLKLVFVDGEMAQGTPPVQACKTTSQGVFGSGAIISGDSLISLEPGKSIEKSGSITIPNGFAGDLYGCITMLFVDEATSTGGISIISRKANLISISVSGEIITDFFIDNIKTIKQPDKTYLLSFRANNKGTVAENISITYNLVDSFGREEPLLGVADQQIYGGDSQDFSVTIPKLHRYGGNYTATIKVTHTPAIIGQDGEQTQTITKSVSFSRGVIKYIEKGHSLIIAFLLFLFLLFIKKRRKDKKTGTTQVQVKEGETHIITTPLEKNKEPSKRVKTFKKRAMPK